MGELIVAIVVVLLIWVYRTRERYINSGLQPESSLRHRVVAAQQDTGQDGGAYFWGRAPGGRQLPCGAVEWPTTDGSVQERDPDVPVRDVRSNQHR